MNRADLLQEMKDSVGMQNPIVFFQKFVDVFNLLFDKIEGLENQIQQMKTHQALAIQWEPVVAADMLVKQIAFMRQDRDTYQGQIGAFKVAYAENKVTQSYNEFVQFWRDQLGYHPFMDYR